VTRSMQTNNKPPRKGNLKSLDFSTTVATLENTYGDKKNTNLAIIPWRKGERIMRGFWDRPNSKAQPNMHGCERDVDQDR
jgi:hypothetical protein